MFFETIFNGLLSLFRCMNAILWLITIVGCGLFSIFVIMHAFDGKK